MTQPASAYIFVSYIGGAGTTDPLPGQHEYPYPMPSSVSLTATAFPTWHFSHWTINSQTFTDNPHSCALHIGAVYDVKAYFERTQYVLSISSGLGGVTDPPNGSYTYNEGTVVNVTALPATGYVFDYWAYDVISYANPIIITIKETRTLYPYFKSSAPPPPTQYDLAIFQGANGTTDPPNGHYLYNVGVHAKVTALPNSGYVFDYWKKDDYSGADYTNPISIGMDGNHSVTPFFKLSSPPPPPPPPNVSLVTVSVAGQGVTDPTVGEHSYTLGATLYVTGTAATGWHYTKMRRNGVDWTSANPGEFLNLAATENIEVVFTDSQPPGDLCKYGTESSGVHTARTLPCSAKAGEIYSFEVAFATPIDPAWGAILCPVFSELYTTPSATAKCTYAYLSTTSMVLEVTITADTIIGTDTFPVMQPTPPDTLTFTQVLDVTPPDNTWLYVVVPVGMLFAVGLGYYYLKKKR